MSSWLHTIPQLTMTSTRAMVKDKSWWDEIKWGTAADWAVAGLTALLFLMACLTIRQGRQQIRKLIEESSERHAADERAQASLVSAWVDQWGAAGIKGHCRNGSQEPVYQVEIMLVATGRRWRVPLMRPEEDRDFEDTSLKEAFDFPVVSVHFVDAAGRSWERLPDGKLERHESPQNDIRTS